MSMIDPVTLSLVKSALDAGTLRQAVHAHNVANANTAGYQPFQVLFEQRLDGVRDALREGRGAQLTAHDMPAAQAVRDAAAGPVSVDTEVAALSRNALHYQALTDALGRQVALMDLAISGGRN